MAETEWCSCCNPINEVRDLLFLLLFSSEYSIWLWADSKTVSGTECVVAPCRALFSRVRELSGRKPAVPIESFNGFTKYFEENADLVP
jgi:hypothetical protein